MVTGISEHTVTYDNGKWVQAFGPTMYVFSLSSPFIGKAKCLNGLTYRAIATAIIAIGTAVWTAVGKEQRGSHFELAVAGHGIIKRKSFFLRWGRHRSDPLSPLQQPTSTKRVKRVKRVPSAREVVVITRNPMWQPTKKRGEPSMLRLYEYERSARVDIEPSRD